MQDIQTLIEEKREQDNIEMLYEMASVGYFRPIKKNGKSEDIELKVFVNGSEGDIPHMHIWDDKTDGQSFHTCICLNEIKYFHHTGKECILSQTQKETLVDFLKSECSKNRRYKTNWEYTLSMWNDNNPTSTKVDETSNVLDYTKLQSE